MILTDEDRSRYTAPPDERDDDQDPWEGAMDEAHAWQEDNLNEAENDHD